MKLKYFLIFFLAISLTKLFLSTTVYSPHIVLDESLYSIIANNIYHNQTYFTDKVYGAQYPPLYSLLLSPFSFFDNSHLLFKYSLFLNSFLSTTVIFPTYYLSKEWLSEKESIFVLLLVGIMPASFIYTFTLMSENLFIPLFITSVYFMKKTLDNNNFKNNSLAGLFISLTVLTKLTAVCLISVYVWEKIYQYYQNLYMLQK